MASPGLKHGFETLRDRKRLDKAFEPVVMRFLNLFGRDAIEAARWRIAHPYVLL
jgi:hypothetical protein